MVDSAQLPIMKNDHYNPNFHSWHGLPGENSQPSSLFRRQTASRGSMRKMLPPTPDMDTQMNLSAKMIDRRTSTPKGNHSYGPFFLEYSLLAEYNLLQKQKMPGVYAIPSATSPLCWYGVLFIRQGLYQEGVFRFKLFIPDNYPDGDCPRFVFDHPVFHPSVDATTNELDLRRGFHKWKRNVNHLWQVLLFARRIFYKIDAAGAVNAEAAELYAKNTDQFKDRAAACVAEWRSRLYDPPPTDDPHYLTFAPFEPAVHESYRQKMKSGDEEQDSLLSSSTSSKGLSFIEPGDTIQIFSREMS